VIRLRLTTIVAGCALALVAAAPAAAETFKPTRKDDPKPSGCRAKDCSLREAVIAANKHAGTDTIRLRKGTYLLKRRERSPDVNNSRFGDLDLTGAAKLVGAGPDRTAVSAGQSSSVGRVLHLQGSLNAFALSDLAVVEGVASFSGGGILAENIGGSLRLKRVAVTGNRASSSGGGIHSSATTLKITKSTIDGNFADNQGGGIFLPATGNLGPVTATIRASTVSLNRAVLGGGGVVASGHDAGGFPNPPQLELLNSTVGMNQTSQSGGGVLSTEGGTATLDNVTVAHNMAETDGAGLGVGGGVARTASAGTFSLGDVLLAANTVGAGGNGSQCAGLFEGLNGNVIQLQAGTACVISASITEPVDALIGSLGDNGGPTETVPLLAGSAAIGFAESCTMVDQRGQPRPETDCDSGAFELPEP
jgi:predicted outer membrane repeat protein